MLRLLFDQDFNHDILRGLLLRLPDVDGVTALQAGLDEAPDPELLDWAAQQRRTVVTHDVNTMPDHAYRRIRQGEPVAGVFVVPQELPIGPGNR
jgi:predicted nuclease of predicted toxin-antitoxin system